MHHLYHRNNFWRPWRGCSYPFLEWLYPKTVTKQNDYHCISSPKFVAFCRLESCNNFCAFWGFWKLSLNSITVQHYKCLNQRIIKPPLATALGLSICSSVCLSDSVAKMLTLKRDFLKNLAIYSYGLYWRHIGSRIWAFRRTHYWTPKIQDGGDMLETTADNSAVFHNLRPLLESKYTLCYQNI